MDIEFTVDVIEGKNFGHPLAENGEYLISIGIGGSLDQALQMATSGSCAGSNATTSWSRPRPQSLSASP